MSEDLITIVGRHIWLDYFDQNCKFDDAFTPQSCKVVGRFGGSSGEKDWYLIELDTSFEYEGAKYEYLMIRSRWVGCKIGEKEATAVFIVLVPDVGKLTEPFEMDMALYIAWGMAYQDTAANRSETSKRQQAENIMQSIRVILFDDWDPIGVNDLAPKDEYDRYIGGVYRLLVSHASDAEVCEYLRQQEITQMEMVTSPEHRKMVAGKLMQLDVSLVE